MILIFWIILILLFTQFLGWAVFIKSDIWMITLSHSHFKLRRVEMCVANFIPLRMVRVRFMISCQICGIEVKIHHRQTDKQTNKLFDTIYGGVHIFFFQLNLLPPYSLHLQRIKWKYYFQISRNTQSHLKKGVTKMAFFNYLQQQYHLKTKK